MPQMQWHWPRYLVGAERQPNIYYALPRLRRDGKAMIDEIRDRLKLSDVIGKQHKLRPAGRDRYRVSPCPLCGKAPHNPSFSISDDIGKFYCHACGKGGSVVDWTMLTKGVDIGEAVRLLAAEAGVTLRGEETPAKSRAAQVRQLVAEAGAY